MLDVLSNRYWLLEEGYLTRMAGIFADRLRLGHSIESLVKKQSLEDYMPRFESLITGTERLSVGGDMSLPVANVNGNRIVMIPVIGGMTKYGELCSFGMQDYQKWMSIANASPEIQGILLVMDTPGGTVDGTPEFGHAVKNSMKPVGVFGDGMVASAGMWVASQAKVIVGNKLNPTSFGSIGTLMVDEDYTNLVESGRLQKLKIIRAPQSTEKALVNPIEPLTSETEALVIEQLRLTTNDFISTVKAGRGDKLQADADGLFNGRMFDAAKAKQIGLIDSVGTMQTALNKLVEIIRQEKSTGVSAQAEQVNTNTMEVPFLSALFGKAEKADGLSADEKATMEAAEKKLAEMDSQLKTASQAVEAATAQVKQLEASVTELTAQVATLTTAKEALETEKADLQKKLEEAPAGAVTSIIPAEPRSDAKYLTSVDEEKKKYKTN